jgi:hypothetical protein
MNDEIKNLNEENKNLVNKIFKHDKVVLTKNKDLNEKVEH